VDAPDVVDAADPTRDDTQSTAAEEVNPEAKPSGVQAEPGEPEAAEEVAEAALEQEPAVPTAAPEQAEEPTAASEEPLPETLSEPAPDEPEEPEPQGQTVTDHARSESAGAEPPGEPSPPEEEAGGEKSMMALLMEGGEFLPESHQRGDLVKGTVIRKDESQLILDIGAKQEGIVPAGDLARLPKSVLDEISVGDSVEAVVLRPEGREGGVLVSLSQARAMADWNLAHDYMDSGEILELEVVGQNKGGALVGFHNLQGFVPRSHLVRLASVNDAEAISRGLTELVGQHIPVKIIEVSRRKRRLIMSERLAVREWRSEQKKRLLDQLHEGEVRTGRVSSVADFGVFVDLGGADGLVHVSELTHERGRHPRDVVKVGQEVQVYVLNIDREKKRIGLSMKRLQSDPWATVEEDHYVGELVEATISNLAKFGAFARLEDGLEGLIHISELSDGHIEHPREVVRPGMRVTVEIIAIEPDRQRVGLSIRRVPQHLRTFEEPEAPAEPERPARPAREVAPPPAAEEEGPAPPTPEAEELAPEEEAWPPEAEEPAPPEAREEEAAPSAMEPEAEAEMPEPEPETGDVPAAGPDHDEDSVPEDAAAEAPTPEPPEPEEPVDAAEPELSEEAAGAVPEEPDTGSQDAGETD
jgi:small subunit ribosomal protein S1